MRMSRRATESTAAWLDRSISLRNLLASKIVAKLLRAIPITRNHFREASVSPRRVRAHKERNTDKPLGLGAGGARARPEVMVCAEERTLVVMLHGSWRWWKRQG